MDSRRTRSIIGTQSLINAGIANKVVALRNGTIGWTLRKPSATRHADRAARLSAVAEAGDTRPEVAYRAGVRHVDVSEARALEAQRHPRALSLRRCATAEEYAVGHIAQAFAPIRAGSWCRRSTWAAPGAARGSC